MLNKISLTLLLFLNLFFTIHCTGPSKQLEPTVKFHTESSYLHPIVLQRNDEILFINSEGDLSKISVNITSSNNYSCVFDSNINTPKLRWSSRQNLYLKYEKPNLMAEVLGNGKIVIAFGEYWFEEDVYPRETVYDNLQMQFLIVNVSSNHCRHKKFVQQLKYKKTSHRWPFPSKTQIIPYLNKFDLFISSWKHCNPPGSSCLIRFDSNGNIEGQRSFSEFETGGLNQEIYPITKFSPKDGYIYRGTIDLPKTYNNTIVMKLNNNLKIVESIKLKGSDIALSVMNGTVGVCVGYPNSTVNANPSSFRCFKLDKQLKVQEHYDLIDFPLYRHILLQILEDESILLITAERNYWFEMIPRGSFEFRKLGNNRSISKLKTLPAACDTRSSFREPKFLKYKEMYCFVSVCLWEHPFEYISTQCIQSRFVKNL